MEDAASVDVEETSMSGEEIKLIARTGPSYGTNPDANDNTGGDEKKKYHLILREKFQYILNCIRRRNPLSSPPRTIYFLDPERNKEGKFRSNRISTTKYNILTFFPRFLFDQFRRYANLFFLFISLLQQLPGISPTGRFTTIVPLLLILIVTAIKEIIEDSRRFRADNQVNYSKVKVLCGDPEEGWNSASWVWKRWTKVKVGDIVCVENKSFFPADLLLLSSSGDQGICYVETSNLDGETNLKIRQAHPDTAQLNQDNILKVGGWYVECEGPNNRLYEFTGNLHKKTLGDESMTVQPLQPDQVLLRGAQLRNTEHILGLVIYTGHDSKLLQNTTQAPLKRSRMEYIVNRQVLALFGVLIVLAVLSSVFAAIWNGVSVGIMNHWYLAISTNPMSGAANFFKSILTFIILYNNLIPISLIVTLEIVKFVQSFFINWDLDMYHKGTDTPALARNSNLNEELGQVRYIFSDKTGTLTENIMIFKKCSVGGKIYGLEPSSEGTQHRCLDLRQALEESKDIGDSLKSFLMVLALCHTVIPEMEDGKTVYRASSPDEEALVNAARDLGIVFKARTPDAVIIEVNGQEEKYEVLNLLEFNSTRKRMSVIYRTPDGEIKLLCKGADSVIYERMTGSQEWLSGETEKHLVHFAIDGLRTLCIAERRIEESLYLEWNERYHGASISLSNREEELDKVAEEIEKELTLLGATAIEDRLQEGVPNAIATLRAAGMKVWVLTGDKQETAINIGFACRQLTARMTLLIIDASSPDFVRTQLEDHLRTYRNTLEGVNKESNAALIIDGKGLLYALKDDMKSMFLELAMACKSVICCRVSPLQKADVVKLVQSTCKNEVTLAIGDGANDVGMIQAAHVGVGISGREGLQATLASDYAIAQFRFLVKLLLVHGAWDYIRLAVVVLFSFYKNICLYIIEFWFAMFNGFSGQPLFERWTIGLFNVLFTAFGLFSFGLLEQDVSAATRLAKPSLYKSSQKGKYFNAFVFYKWVGLSLYHSIALFFGASLMVPHLPFSNGKVAGLWYTGNIVYTSVVITVNLKLALETQFWPWIHHVTVWGSILLWILFLAVYSHFWPTFNIAVEMVGQDAKLFGSMAFYSIMILAPALAMLPDFFKTVIQKIFFPTDLDKERTAEILYERRTGRGGRYQPIEEVTVSYSAYGAEKYADGLEQEDEEVPLVRLTGLTHGFAFAQEDYRKKSTTAPRRNLIRTDTSNKRNS